MGDEAGWKLQSARKTAIDIASLSLFLYPLLLGVIGAPPALVFRPIYLMLLFILGILCLPSKIFNPGSVGEYILNGVLLSGALATIWVANSWVELILTFNLSALQMFGGICLLLASMEITRRTPVACMNYIAIPAILYALFGNHIPGLLGHAGMSLERLLWSQLFTTEGLFGSPLAIGATYIGLFVFFSAFLEVSGGGEKFMNFTVALAGRFSGGSAKVAVVASGLMGMITGSSVTNIVTTGVITIPMMKRGGFKAEMAGGIESTASLGSQITPPIMGATAFLICEFAGVSYLKVMAIAIGPCLLYYLGLFTQVHMCALKLGIGGLPAKELPSLRKSSLEVIPFVVPIVILVLLLVARYSEEYCISMTIGSYFFICLLHKDYRHKILKNFMTGIREGAASLLSLVSSLTIAGLIIGVLTMTGLGDRLSYLIELLSRGNFHLLVFLTALICSLLGMGMVTIGDYVMVAVVTAPLMVHYGVPLLAAHMFIFYFAVTSAITPPVMVGVFAASSIAQSDMMKTAWNALRLAVAGFVVPVVFVYNPAMLFLDGITLKGLFYFLTAALGIVCVGIAFERHSFFGRLPLWKVALYLVTGILAMWPTMTPSIVGIILFALLSAFDYLAAKTKGAKKGIAAAA